MNYLEIRAAIVASPELTALLPDSEAIASKIKVTFERQVGRGDILSTLGLMDGNNFLDEIKANQLYRHVWPLLEAGHLNIGDEQVRAAIDLFVPSKLTAEQASALKALAETTVNEIEVRKAIWNDNGTRAV